MFFERRETEREFPDANPQWPSMFIVGTKLGRFWFFEAAGGPDDHLHPEEVPGAKRDPFGSSLSSTLCWPYFLEGRGPGEACHRSAAGISRSPPPLSGKGCPAQDCVCGGPSLFPPTSQKQGALISRGKKSIQSPFTSALSPHIQLF